jgi:hypothetical protein
MDKWQKIETAPKDGTEIFITHPSWHGAVQAKWEFNDYIDGAEQQVWLVGWCFDEWTRLHGLVCEEEGFLGWDTEIMPTHWAPLPFPKPTTED